MIPPSLTYPGSTVDGSTRHDNAAAILSFASASIACSRSNSVAQPTCCTHKSPPGVSCASCTAATQPTLVVLLPAPRLFGDHLHSHLIPSHHRLLSHESSSASLPHTLLHLSISRSPSHGGGCFPRAHYIHKRPLSPDLFGLCWVNRPIGVRYRLVPCGSLNLPTDRLPPAASSPHPFFLLLRI